MVSGGGEKNWEGILRQWLSPKIHRATTLCALRGLLLLLSAVVFFRRADFCAGRGGHTRFVGHQPETRVDVGDLHGIHWRWMGLVKI